MVIIISLRELEHGKTDNRQTEFIKTYQLCWKKLKNRPENDQCMKKLSFYERRAGDEEKYVLFEILVLSIFKYEMCISNTNHVTGNDQF